MSPGNRQYRRSEVVTGHLVAGDTGLPSDGRPVARRALSPGSKRPTLSESSRLAAMRRYWWNKPEALRRSAGVRSSRNTKASPLRLLKKSVGSSQSDFPHVS